jgi:hypothetical protein
LVKYQEVGQKRSNVRILGGSMLALLELSPHHRDQFALHGFGVERPYKKAVYEKLQPRWRFIACKNSADVPNFHIASKQGRLACQIHVPPTLSD